MDALKKAEEGLEAAKKANASRITVQSSPSPSSLVSDFFYLYHTKENFIQHHAHYCNKNFSVSTVLHFADKSVWLLLKLAYTWCLVLQCGFLLRLHTVDRLSLKHT